MLGIITQVQAAGRAGHAPDVWRRHLDNAARLARESLAEARWSVRAVVPGALEQAQLPDALAHLVAQWQDLNGVPADMTTGGAHPLRRDMEVTLLRAAQESLANIARHARASHVRMTLSYLDDVVRLDVHDDGVGFDPSAARAGEGYGLTAMRERIDALAGAVEIESRPGSGTVVSLCVPTAYGAEGGDG